MDITVTVVAERLDVEDDGDHDKTNETNEVRPDVASFSVNPEDRFEAFGKAGKLGPVAKMQVVVVSHPVGKHVKVASLPISQLLDVGVHHFSSVLRLLMNEVVQPLHHVLNLLVGRVKVSSHVFFCRRQSSSESGCHWNWQMPGVATLSQPQYLILFGNDKARP